MAKVILGQYATPEYFEGPTVFESKALWLPNHNIIGVATSFHPYHLAPISELDVQEAFQIVRDELTKYGPGELNSAETLQNVLQAVYRGFAEIDIHGRMANLKFESVNLVNMFEPANDFEAKPLVWIALVQLSGQGLSIASFGDFLVYVVRSTGQELIYGWDWYSGVSAGGVDDFPGLPVTAHLDMPNMYQLETKVLPGDLIIVTTHTLGEVISLAKLDSLMHMTDCNSEAANHHIMNTLKLIIPENKIDLEEPHSTTKSFISKWGAAWAITCVAN
jgi:hypothetical protein